jgi:hypothetical protein
MFNVLLGQAEQMRQAEQVEQVRQAKQVISAIKLRLYFAFSITCRKSGHKSR